MKLDVTPEELLALHDMLTQDAQPELYDFVVEVRSTIIEAIRLPEKLAQYEAWKKTQEEKIASVDEPPPGDVPF